MIGKTYLDSWIGIFVTAVEGNAGIEQYVYFRSEIRLPILPKALRHARIRGVVLAELADIVVGANRCESNP